jgi:hypothetical protein
MVGKLALEHEVLKKPRVGWVRNERETDDDQSPPRPRQSSAHRLRQSPMRPGDERNFALKMLFAYGFLRKHPDAV